MAAFNTSYGGSAEINELSRMDRSKGGSGSGTITSLRFGRRKTNKDTSGSRNSSKATKSHAERYTRRRSEGLGNEADVIHEDAGSVGSGGSRQMIIQKDVTWDVEYSSPPPVQTRLVGAFQ